MFAQKLLMTAVGWLGVSSVPLQLDSWQVSGWQQDMPGRWVMTAKSAGISIQCASDVDKYLKIPRVIHGTHEVFADGRLIDHFGDPTYKTVRSFYGAPFVSCSRLAGAKEVEWRVYNYSQYFSRIPNMPNVTAGANWINFFDETLNIISGGALIVLPVFCIFAFTGSLPPAMIVTMSAAGLGMAGYLMMCSVGLLGAGIPMLLAHKVADIFVGIGGVGITAALHLTGLAPRIPVLTAAGAVAIGSVLIAIAGSGDAVQFGTAVSLPAFLVLVTGMGLQSMSLLWRDGFTRMRFFQAISVASLAAAAVNDIVIVLGLSQGPILLSLGMPVAFFALAMSVNEQVRSVHSERDWLKSHLEAEVARKTDELKVKNADLEMTVTALKEARAEILHTEKMASLGTLAAGIAHEINNSLNFVYGALGPMEKIVKNEEIPQNLREKALKLLVPMREGLRLTFEIITSLRTYSGSAERPAQDTNVSEVIRGTVALLKSKIRERDIVLTVTATTDLSVVINPAALHQILGNLIGNAADAVGPGGKIEVAVEQNGPQVFIHVRDNGPGVPEVIRHRIFDPFFTTKDVGKGSGIGLYVVRREVERHGGKIELSQSKEGGAAFTVKLPSSKAEGSPNLHVVSEVVA